MGRVLCGTPSWTKDGWMGSFYPLGTKPADKLTWYATQFQTVEADTTYYGVPRPEVVRGWRQKTPSGFVFSAKFPRSIVHGGADARPDPGVVLVHDRVQRDLELFLAAMSELGDRAGPLVLQFPQFDHSAFARVEDFIARLDPFLFALPRTFRYAVEVRNQSWVGARLLDVLRAHKVAFVLLDFESMPHPADLAREHDLVTSDFTYSRLMGDRKAIGARTQTFDRIVLDQGARLDRWAELLSTLDKRVAETLAYASDHFAGHGPTTARELARKIEERSSRSP